MQVLGLVEKMRKDAKANEQAGREMKEEALRYANKYKEVNDVLNLRNEKKATLVREKQELKESKE